MNGIGRVAVAVGALLASAGACCALASDVEAVASEAPAKQPGARKEVLSQVYSVDRVYKSMMGPQSTVAVALSDSPTPELLWITGYEAVMVAPNGETPMAQDFMCHSNLDWDPSEHNRLFADQKAITSRLFTLSQGQFVIEFPAGFGIPVLSSERLLLTTQVLNLDAERPAAKVRHKVTLHFVRDSELTEPMKPLFAAGAYGLRLLEGKDAYFGVPEGDAEHHGPGCLPGTNASDFEYPDQFGRRFTGHWVVQPGREENRTLVTKLLNLPFATTVHYIAVHLHPFAESLELRDLTTGKSVFKSKARQFPDRIGLAEVDYLSSPEGIMVYPDHEYEIVSSYNNTSGQPQDSMAVMGLYLLDKTFVKPQLSADAAGQPAPATQPAPTTQPAAATQPATGN